MRQHTFKSNICLTFIVIIAAVQTLYAEQNNHDHHMKEPAGDVTSNTESGTTAKVDRIIEVSAIDNKFLPETINVKRGETIKFIIINNGKLPHEFVLGNVEEQAHHNMQMKSMSAEEMASHTEANAVALQPGQTQTFIWSFNTESEEIQFACHVPGHYEAGMLGLVKINKE